MAGAVADAVCHLEQPDGALEHIQQANAAVLHFYAPWAQPCKDMAIVFQQLALQHSADIKFFQIHADQATNLCEKFNVETVPTFVFLHQHTETDRITGADPQALALKVKQNALTSMIHNDRPVISTPLVIPIEEKLHSLINMAAVTLFMKGDRDVPKCGFSRKMVALLNEHRVKFTTFDILEDEEVRQGLKTYSNWPTYPQLYADGKFIGGLDIITELAQEDELIDSLPSEAVMEV